MQETLDPQLRKKLLFQMVRIRHYEEEIARRYHEQKMRCPVHLSTGQEGVPAAVFHAFTHEDLAVSTHRCHGHYLGKGGDGKRMIAELYGKATGCTQGRGGSMHLIDRSVGYKASTAIVGNSIPIGVGLGLALALDKKKAVSIVFIGDAAVEEGAFFESANYAAVKKLPVLFVCENNFYSVYSGLDVRQPQDRKIHKFSESIGMRTYFGDGNDVEFCYRALTDAREAALKGEGPQFLEFETYRWREHCGANYDNDIGYRTPGEFESWKKRDPIACYEKSLLDEGILTSEERLAMHKKIEEEVDEAFEFAENSPFPESSEAFKYLFKENRRLS